MKLKLYLLSILLFFVLLPVLYVFAAGIDSVGLVLPGNDTLSNQDNDTITFTFNFTGDNASASCVFYVTNSTSDFVAVGENTTVLNVTNTDIQSNSSIAEGVRQWYVNCTNSTTIQSAIWTLNIDRTEPLVTINNPSNTTINSDAFNFTYNEVNCSVYYVDGGSNTTNCSIVGLEWTGTLGGLSDGQHNITVWANDSAGNANQTVLYWSRDTVAPTIYLAYPTNTTYDTSTLDLNVSSDGTEDGWSYNINGTGNTSFTPNTTITGGEGGNNITVYVNDSAGNWNETIVYFTVDSTNPVPNIVIPANTTYNYNPELNFTYTETNPDSCWYSLNGSSNITLTDCDTNGTTLSTGDGGQNIRLCTNDTVGREGCDIVYYTKDTSAPSISITLPANTTYNTNSIWFNVSAGDSDTCIVNYGYGNKTMTNSSGNWNHNNNSMNDGGHQAIFYCNDSGNNWGSNNIYFTVDTVYPVIENVTSGSVTFSTAIVTWDTNENANSSVGYGTTLALGSTSSATSLVTSHSRTLTSLASSTLYYYNVTSCDQAGNCNESGPYNFTTSVCSESWSCGEWSVCVGGLQTRGCTDSNSCGTTASRPSLSQECISGGGTSKPKPPEVRHAWSKITPGVEALMSIDKSGLDFTEIRISVKNQANQVSITVTKIEGSPADVEKEVSGKTYQYIRIQESNLDDANIEKSKIKFKVSKTWISENSINELTVGLNRYTDDWIELPTTLTSEDDDYFYYEAETPGFSVFAITGKEIVCTSDEMRCSGNELQKCTSDGTDWETTEICEYGCDSASLSCKSQGACEAEEMRCSGKTLQKCSTYTYDWETLETCEYQCLDNKCTEAAPDYSGLYIGVVVIVMIILLFVWMKPKSLKKMFKKK